MLDNNDNNELMAQFTLAPHSYDDEGWAALRAEKEPEVPPPPPPTTN